MAATTDILRKEHEVIKQGLSVLEAMALRVERGEHVPPADLEDLLRFVQGFADKLHHSKEEDVLFPAMLATRDERALAMIVVLLCEHDEGRGFVKTMAESARSLHDGAARGKLVYAARAYVAMLRDHIVKEDEAVYQLADEILTGERGASLPDEYRKHEAKAAPEGAAPYVAIVDRLAREYLPAG